MANDALRFVSQLRNVTCTEDEKPYIIPAEQLVMFRGLSGRYLKGV
jgi:hypothetical protein